MNNRNQPCSCGSQRKFKKCCGSIAAQKLALIALHQKIADDREAKRKAESLESRSPDFRARINVMYAIIVAGIIAAGGSGSGRYRV